MTSSGHSGKYSMLFLRRSLSQTAAFFFSLVLVTMLAACGAVQENHEQSLQNQTGGGSGTSTESQKGTETGAEIEEKQGSESKPGEKLQVVASFYPLYEFASAVGGEEAEVHVLVPAGVEPHDWEPSPKDVQQIANADLLIYNGAGFEPWIETVLASVSEEQMVVVNASEGVPMLQGKEDEHEHDGAEEQETLAKTDHPEGLADPHIWLDPVRAQQMVQNVLQGYQKADPAKSEDYALRAQVYIDKLEQLYAQYEEALSQVPRRTFITSHAAFGYLADRYDLVQRPILGLAPDAEPTPAALAELARFAKEEEIRVIFFESLVNPKVAEVLAEEVGAQVLPLNPIEGLTPEEMQNGENYVSLMEENLENLLVALGERPQ